MRSSMYDSDFEAPLDIGLSRCAEISDDGLPSTTIGHTRFSC